MRRRKKERGDRRIETDRKIEKHRHEDEENWREDGWRKGRGIAKSSKRGIDSGRDRYRGRDLSFWV
jgi:hypothetical protein